MNKTETMIEAAFHVGAAEDSLYDLLESGAYTDEKIRHAIDTAISYLSEIAGNMWAIAEDRPEDIEEL